MYGSRSLTSRSTTSQLPAYRRPYEPELLQSAVYSRTTQANPSSGSYQQWKPSVAAARRRDNDIESFIPSLKIPTTSSLSSTPGSGSDNPPPPRSRTSLASTVPPSLRRPSHTSSRQSFDRDSRSQSTISATPKFSNDSPERRAFPGVRRKEVPVVETAERPAAPREPEAARDVPVEQSRVEVMRLLLEGMGINSGDETPTVTSRELVLQKQDPELEDPRSDFTTALVPTTIGREDSSLSSIEIPSDGHASRDTQETVATSVSSSASPLGVAKVQRPARDASFDLLFEEDSSVPKPAQSTFTDPQAPRKGPPTERSYADVGTWIVWISPMPVKVDGHFCDVFQATHSRVGKVALKRPRIGAAGCNEDTIRRFQREAATWKRLQHPHILEYLGTFQKDGYFYLVSPFVENGTLVDYIVLDPSVNRVKLMCETADAINYLHDEEVVHGDIKASNILIGDNGQVLLCDFGLTRTTDFRTSTAMKGAGTLRWQSPELWDGGSKSFKSDVYAFGMTIAEALTGEVPFPDLQTDGAVIRAVLIQGRRPPKNPAESSTGLSYEKVWAVAEACWSDTPEERISMSEALQFIQGDPALTTIQDI